MSAAAKEKAKELVGAGIQHGWIKAPASDSLADTDTPSSDEEARDRYLEIWWRLREIELERLKLDNERIREEMLLLSFERASIVNRKS